MKPSDRVALIKTICVRLAELDWSDLDLTLRQFGLSWSASWSGDKYSYCVHHVEQGADTVLAELHEHLFDGKEFAGAVLDEARGPWVAGRFRLFLSHVSRDKEFISALKLILGQYGIDGFVAHEDIDPTNEWQREIEHALSTCDALAAYMTSHFHESLWTDQEIGFCVRRRVLIVPIRAGRDPYGFIARYQALAGVGKAAPDLAEGLFNLLAAHDLTANPMASALVAHFEDSGSFADAKRNVGLLKSIKQWTPELLERVEQAVVRNGQVESAWGVPNQVRALVEQHRQ